MHGLNFIILSNYFTIFDFMLIISFKKWGFEPKYN